MTTRNDMDAPPATPSPSTPPPTSPAGDEQALLAALAATTDAQTMQRLLTDILTPDEYAMLCRRWSILRQIHHGRTQRAVAAALNASLCSVTRGSRILRDPASAAACCLVAADGPPAPRRKAPHPARA